MEDTKMLSTLVPVELHDKVHSHSVETGLKKNKIIIVALEAYFNQIEKKEVASENSVL